MIGDTRWWRYCAGDSCWSAWLGDSQQCGCSWHSADIEAVAWWWVVRHYVGVVSKWCWAVWLCGSQCCRFSWLVLHDLIQWLWKEFILLKIGDNVALFTGDFALYGSELWFTALGKYHAGDRGVTRRLCTASGSELSQYWRLTCCEVRRKWDCSGDLLRIIVWSVIVCWTRWVIMRGKKILYRRRETGRA